MTFVEYCKEKGISPLRDDLRFIKRLLLFVPDNQRRAFLSAYVEEWLLGMGESTIDAQKMNLGRRRANLWLLKELG